jgi:hypothetical protein
MWTDVALASRTGVVVAFTERSGGASQWPYASLNLAAHVGDDPDHVDENRATLLSALGCPGLRDRIVTADQVHGSTVTLVGEGEAGAGAWAGRGTGPITATDALATSTPNVPLLMLFADCVPIVLAALGGRSPTIAVVHAGWRGALAGIPAAAVRSLAFAAGCTGGDVLAYVGPHICATHYEVGADIMSQFATRFDTVARAESGPLDLGAVVSESLLEAGVAMTSQCRVGACTAEQTDRFFSYRAEGVTGRHGAIAVVLGRGA